MDIKSKLESKEYDFLREEKSLKNTILLTTGGSYAYGTNIETKEHTSDLDIRGIYLNSAQEILSMNCINKPYEHVKTDTVIYPFKQIINLLLNVNPNVIEILGTKEEHLFIYTDEGKLLRDNVDLFLTKRAVNSFGGYAISQLRRLQNALARDEYKQREKEEHIMNSIKRQMKTFEDRYKIVSEEEIKLYIEESKRADLEEEIFIDVNLRKYPLRDLKGMWSEMNNILKDYSKLNHRNNKKDALHLNKHAMHLIRLFLMGIEILEGKGINTYRKNDKELLLDIRNGRYTYDEIFEMVNELDKKFKYAERNSCLPNSPDMNKVNELVMYLNSKVLSM
ncbi:TPA: DNA polymerase beta superfamily protein [Clostridioides difficile]|uniref:DNA polymerase beta superfamily protein n=1 Tax=Clostridioides difficile TaxID=1496 RepID=UPI0020C3685F|nr:nucleotidyltransferase domain-containing protein [Clostridioides difficile]MCP8368482.1 nucleotidyltransferase domain-containing protein [Clostridioides difficile]MCP8386770.1 nucleotidyltransferase domain-containing protein [Clostridioides difficile]HCQ5967530.1 nucleotidyltransferase domain-containing protein [Clostridioides difficile]